MPITYGAGIPPNAHVFASETSRPEEPHATFVVHEKGNPAAKVDTDGQVIVTREGRVHELVPRAPLRIDTEYTVVATRGATRYEWSFTTGAQVDASPPVFSPEPATVVWAARKGCPGPPAFVELASARDDATPASALAYLIWTADDEDHVDVNAPPDDVMSGSSPNVSLPLETPDETPFTIAVQVIDAAGHRMAPILVTVPGGSWSIGRKFRAFRARARRDRLVVATIAATSLAAVALLVLLLRRRRGG